MYSTTCILFKRQALHHHVVSILGLLRVNQAVVSVVDPEEVRIPMLTDLAGELLPEECRKVFSLSGLLLDCQPPAQAIIVDKANTAAAFASLDAWVVF